MYNKDVNVDVQDIFSNLIPYIESNHMYTYIRNDSVCRASCAAVQKMLAGNYYSSSGPEIRDWGIRGNVANVDCSPVYRIDFVAGNDINDGISRVCGSYDDTIELGEYELIGHETYVRVKSTDKSGKSAWSNTNWLAN